MLAQQIIEKYYKKNSLSYFFLYTHSSMVAKNAVRIAKHNKNLNVDIDFIKNAAMLHDIGIFMTNAPSIGCFGTYPYISHGYLGRELLEKDGLNKIALICERHIGMGITLQDIENKGLPLPKRDMIPISIEEKIICYADKFFSKNSIYLTSPKPIKTIKQKLSKYGVEKVAKFEEMMEQFGWDYIYD